MARSPLPRGTAATWDQDTPPPRDVALCHPFSKAQLQTAPGQGVRLQLRNLGASSAPESKSLNSPSSVPRGTHGVAPSLLCLGKPARYLRVKPGVCAAPSGVLAQPPGTCGNQRRSLPAWAQALPVQGGPGGPSVARLWGVAPRSLAALSWWGSHWLCLLSFIVRRGEVPSSSPASPELKGPPLCRERLAALPQVRGQHTEDRVSPGSPTPTEALGRPQVGLGAAV